MESAILSLQNLSVAFDTEAGEIRALDDISFSVPEGRTLGLVGESGCGKSVTALSIMRLLPKPAGRIASGRILFDGTDIVSFPARRMNEIRGRRISMIFQEPMTSLNPVHRIGKQVAEVFRLHFPQISDSELRNSALKMLKIVGIPDPEQRMKEYPHQISGGMRQRVMIAIALACRPDILIADEPSTALDVTIQAQILNLIAGLQAETGMSVIFITHDLGVIAEICDRVVVMYAGKVVESASTAVLFQNPRHPYTQGLLSSIPRLETPRKAILNIIPGIVPSLYDLPQGCRFQTRCPHARAICGQQPEMRQMEEEDHFAACHFAHELDFRQTHPFFPSQEGNVTHPLILSQEGNKNVPSLEEKRLLSEMEVKGWVNKSTVLALDVKNLKMHFPVHGGMFLRRTGTVYAVDGISFSVARGKTLGLVGESGCGKTTAGRALIRLYEPTEGQIFFEGQNILSLNGTALQSFRRQFQIIFQDPFESLNSRHTVGQILEEPFIIHRSGTPSERREQVKTLLNRVGLSSDAADRFPHEFSGGQRQRIGIARAIALNPRMIVCDEPVSALDVSIQSQIINLLLELQQDMGLTYLFISHDLTVVRHISDHIAVMYLGKIVEYTDADTIYQTPLHPYTRALLSAIPVPRPGAGIQKQILTGDVPSPIKPPSGCRFRTRCPIVIDRCRMEEPLLKPAPKTEDGRHQVACHRVE